MISYLGLGSNLGDRKQNLLRACILLGEISGITVKRSSQIIETKPYGGRQQPDFLNSVLEIDTDLPPAQLLEQLKLTEKKMKRIKRERWGPRIIDIDILYYGDKIISRDVLAIPHPDLQNREFVLKPLLELAPDFLHPVLKKTNKELYRELWKEEQLR